MTQEELARRDRLASLRQKGIDPYPAECEREHEIAGVLEHFQEYETTQSMLIVAGRVLAIRQMGGVTFVRLLDGTGAMQVVLKSDVIGEETYALFTTHADVGDFFGFAGTAFVTKKGEKSVLASSWNLLSKALSPLPEKWHGLQDVEMRYRQRELDLIVNPEVKARFVMRSKMISAMRAFLEERGFMEVETPMLQPIPGGASARPFVTHHNALNADLYLRIAPELYLKRLVVGGFEKVYEIGRCFRNEGIDYAHNPEFTMLELYWAYARKDEFVQFLEELVTTVVMKSIGSLEMPYGDSTMSFVAPWPRMTFREAILAHADIDIDTLASPEDVVRAVKEKGLAIDFKDCIGMGEHLDVLWKKTARPSIAQPTWIFDYPVDLKPLAKALVADPTKSATVQLVVQGAEVLNAYYHELNDPLDQRARFVEQESLRARGNEEAQYLDEEFLSALERAMPPTSGMGVGIDRLVAFLTDAPNLKEVILFPTLKPRND